MNELMERYGVCLRTCYRHIKRGIESFCCGLERLGYNKKKLLLLFGNEPLFQTMLSVVIREDDAERRNGPLPRERKSTINNRHNPLLRGNDRGGCYC